MRSFSLLQLFIVASWNLAFAFKSQDIPEDEPSLCFESLLRVIRKNDAERIQVIFDANEDCDINEKFPDESGLTLLSFSCLHGKSSEVIAALLDNGADVNIVEKNNYTALHIAAMQGFARVVQVLIEHPKAEIDVNEKHSDGLTPLHRTCRGNKLRYAETTKILLDNGADPDESVCMKLRDGTSNCRHLIEQTNFPVTKKLLRQYSKLEKYKEEQESQEDESENDESSKDQPQNSSSTLGSAELPCVL